MSDPLEIAAAETAATGDRRRLLIDLASSYALSVARVASMAAMVAILFRYTNAEYAATFVLIRTMLGVLNSSFSGFAPTVQLAIRTSRGPLSSAAVVHSYASTGAMLVACAAFVAATIYGETFTKFHAPAIMRTQVIAPFVTLYAAGLLARLSTEPASGALQARGRLALDNAILIVAELAWPVASWFEASGRYRYTEIFVAIAFWFAAINVSAAILRTLVARWSLGFTFDDGIWILAPRQFLRLLTTSLATSVGGLADLLYAPTNVLIISVFVGARWVADYSPALQFDAALLLLVGAIAATILPRAMRLAGEHRHAELRALYVRSTLISLAVLASAAIALWIAAPTILRLWLGRPMPLTLSVLPFVLIHTVVGGTAGVGRATLLAMGRFRAYTISAVIGGVANVGLALLFVLGFGWGLRGVALATIVAVVARCAIWMPWYVLRATR